MGRGAEGRLFVGAGEAANAADTQISILVVFRANRNTLGNPIGNPIGLIMQLINLVFNHFFICISAID